jgi:hypothetical protein
VGQSEGRSPVAWGLRPIIEAGAPSTGEVVACFRRCARPTGGRYVRTTDAPAQRAKEVSQKSAAKDIIEVGVLIGGSGPGGWYRCSTGPRDP